MPEVRALRELERWSAASITISVVVALAAVAVVGWLVYRYLQD